MHWHKIEDGDWPVNESIIVTDGSYYGPGLFVPGEDVWIDCHGIWPTHWMSYRDLPPVEEEPSLSEID